MKTRHVVGLIGAAVLCVAADANAADPAAVTRAAAVLQAGLGNEGRLDGEPRLRGPGFEQTVLTTLVKDGKQYVVLITMQSFDQKSGYDPWQCSCSSYELQTNAAPKEVVHLQRLTSYPNRERLCNHPAIATDGDSIVWGFGSDNNNDRPNTYVGVIDHMCRSLANPIMVNAKDTSELPANSGITAADNNVPTTKIENNDGAFRLTALGPGKFVGAYLSTAGNATEAVYGLGLSVTKSDVLYTVNRTWIAPIITPSNIGRPTLLTVDSGRALLCATMGNNRPPEGGVYCSILDGASGNQIWKQAVAPSYRDKQTDQMHYFSQPTVAKISDNLFALSAIESNGMGKNTNLKGTNVAHLYTLDYGADALVVNSHVTGVAAYQTHSTICSGAYGVDGKTNIGVISASPSGIGRAEMIMVDFDTTTKQFNWQDDARRWPVTWYGDSGHLANWYGRNPMRQGRDFLNCIGDVANPGYHQDGGYMKDVSSFFVAAVSGRVPGDYKNSLYVSFVPGKADTPSTPTQAAPADDLPPPSTDDNGNNNPPPPQNSSGCACSTPGASTDSGTMLGGLMLLGLVIGATRRRKS